MSLSNTLTASLTDALARALTSIFYWSGVLPTMSAWWLSSVYDGGSDSLTEQTGNGVGNAQLGSTSGGDTNDPLRLVWAQGNGDYVFLPGTASNNIQVARPVASVDVVVTYEDGTTDSSLTAQTANPLIFGDTDVVFAGLKIRSIQLKNNSGGAEVGLWESNQSNQAGMTDGDSNVWTIARTSTGAFSQLVTRTSLQLHTDDYLQIADHVLLQMEDSVDFTFWVYGRVHATINDARYLAHRDGNGFFIIQSGTDITSTFDYSTGTGNMEVSQTGPNLSTSELIGSGRDGSLGFVNTTTNGRSTGAISTDSIAGDNGDMFVGWGGGGANYTTMEVVAFGVIKGTALTSTQLDTIKGEVDSRLGGRSGD